MKTKKWLVIAAALVLLGGIVFVGVMTALRWNYQSLSTYNYVTNTYEISEAFDNISIDTTTAEIEFVRSADGKCKVECHDEENVTYAVRAENGTLFVERIDEISGLIAQTGINFDTAKITVYLPKTQYASLLIKESTGDVKIPSDFDFKDVEIALNTGNVNFGASASETVKIETSTGDICTENTAVGSLDLTVTTGAVTASGVSCKGDFSLKVSTGMAELNDVRCKSFVSSGNTGEIVLRDVIAEEKLSIERSTGGVRFENSDAAEIYVKTDTGYVMGTLRSDKVFIAQSDTGNVDVPKTTDGGKCEITTATGEIEIEINAQ